LRVGRRTSSLILLLAAAAAAWTMLRPDGFEVAVLRTFSGKSDSFTSLWVLDDQKNGFVWIRAHQPSRRWLRDLQEHPQVELRRNGLSIRYEARVFDAEAARRTVGSGFRDKYGLADLAREWIQGKDTVPVRLRSL
jgi:hypothetical protein